MSENQKSLLQQALDMLEEQALHIEAPMLPAGEDLLKRIRAAISQQVEQAQAQGEREAFKQALHGQRVFKLNSDTINAAEWAWFARPAQTEQQPVLSNCLDLVEKMTVSVDVSTGDDDAFNRLFCKVVGVQEESDGSWTILAVDPEPNFAAPIAQTAPQGIPEMSEGARVPDDYRNQATGYRAGWNDCRKAMLDALSAGGLDE